MGWAWGASGGGEVGAPAEAGEGRRDVPEESPEAEEARSEYSCHPLGARGRQALRQEDVPHLLQQPALLAQARLHLPDDLLEPAPLLLHVPLLPAQPLLQRWGRPTGHSLPAPLPTTGDRREGHVACSTSELLISLPDAQLPLLGSAEVRGLHAGGQLVQAAGELLHLLDDAIQGPAGGSGHEGPWTPALPRQVGRAWMARLPRMGGGAGDSVDLPVLQQLQPLQLLLVVLAHLQDGGPGGQWGGRGSEHRGQLFVAGACLRVVHAPWASPPHLRALPHFPRLLCLICLGASMPHPLSGGRFLVFQQRTLDRCADNPFVSGQSEPCEKACSAPVGQLPHVLFLSFALI